jgi:CHAD domain-containing protein
LRLRTALEFRLREQAPEPAAARAFKRWKKEGRKLRRALGPVRDADVHLARLRGLRGALAASTNGESQVSLRCLREMDKLLSRLKLQRQKGAERLKTFMDARGKRLNRLSREMEAELAPQMLSNQGSTAQAALRIFTELAGELPAIGGADLHDYRKRLKQALHLAEASAASDPAAKRLAVVSRKMHLATGKWHDWDALALLAERVLPGHGRQDGVVPVLKKLAEEALKKALALCRRSTACFLKSSFAVRPSPRRKPVAAAPLPAQFTNGENLRISS